MAVKEGAVGLKLAVVGNKLECFKSRQSGERVGRYVLAKTE